MANVLKRLFGEPEPAENVNWFKQVDQLKRQFDDINSEVLNAMKTESKLYLLPAFDSPYR